jgi:hypothetical protein
VPAQVFARIGHLVRRLHVVRPYCYACRP